MCTLRRMPHRGKGKKMTMRHLLLLLLRFTVCTREDTDTLAESAENLNVLIYYIYISAKTTL